MNKVAVYAMALVMMPAMLSSCSLLRRGKKKKKQEIAATTFTDTVSTKEAPLPAPLPDPANAALINTLTPLWHTRLSYTTFSGKAKVSLNSPDVSADFSANVRIAKDSLVWIHVTALGGLYPVARMLVTRDSFFMVDYTQKEVTAIPLSDVGKVLPVTLGLSQLQNLITGDPLADGSITFAEQQETTWSIHTMDSTFLQQLSYKIADSTMITGNLSTRQPNGPKALLSYNNYEVINGRKLSANRVMHIQNGFKNYDLEMNIVNPEFDHQLEFPFSLPKNYKVKVR